MNKTLHIKDASELSITYLHQISIRSQLIYSSILIAIILTLFALPVIKVDISVRSTGMLQPAIEKNDLLIPANGHISKMNLYENQKVKMGDTLISIDPSLNDKQYSLSKLRKQELDVLLHDITYMNSAINLSGTAVPKISNAHYKASWEQYQYEMQTSTVKWEQAEREFKRYEILYKKNVLSASEFEKFKTAYDQSIADAKFLTKKYQTQWQADGEQYRTELNSLEGKLAEWKEQERYFTLVAPVNGSIQKLSGLHKGTTVFINQKIAELSPDSSLLAVCYVSPTDIGLLKPGQKVRFMIDAFNYNQWGVAEGSIIDIADDITTTPDNQPVFKVKCQLNKRYLSLINGYKGQLKKGMTFNARFMITKRSLFQLLYDSADQWLNPNTATNS